MKPSWGAEAFKDLSQSEGEASLPKYERLRNYVVSQIEAGHFEVGVALPSELHIAESLQVARSTVRQALAELEKDGLVRRVHGKGTFVHEQARQRLRKGQDLFALIVPETESGFYPSLQKSFEDAAAELHNQVIICNSGNEIERQGNSILQLIDLKVAGVAIVPTTLPLTPAFHIRQLQQHGIPVVCCSRGVEGAQSPLLGIPFEEAGRRAAEEMTRVGHTRVAFLSGGPTQSVERMVKGFREGCESGVGLVCTHGRFTSPTVAAHEVEVEQQLDRLLNDSHPPTAIFTTFDSFAELIYLLLLRRGLRIPEDVSLVGFGGTRRTGALVSRLSSVTVDEIAMGREAISLLDRMRSGALAIDVAEFRSMVIGFSAGQTLGPPKSI